MSVLNEASKNNFALVKFKDNLKKVVKITEIKNFNIENFNKNKFYFVEKTKDVFEPALIITTGGKLIHVINTNLNNN